MLDSKHAAIDKLVHMPQGQLLDVCYEAHKDHYGIKGRFMTSWSKTNLINWWLEHYTWDDRNMAWDCEFPEEEEFEFYVEELDAYGKMCVDDKDFKL